MLVWDLLNPAVGQNPAVGGGGGGGGRGHRSSNSVGGKSAVLMQNGGSSTPRRGGGGEVTHSPVASWQCEFEVGNFSWAPQSGLTARGGGGEWLGVSGARSVWGVAMRL